MKTGVFVCHCGINISKTVDIEKVLERLKSQVDFITDYKYLCSDPGQEIVKKAVAEHKLDGVVIAACSPTLHENTFRRAVSSVGLNPYLCEIANIREQCSWVEKEKEIATRKAVKIIKSIVYKVKMNEALFPIKIPVVKKVLVIGGGIAGIESALNIIKSGYEVVLIEKEEFLGGNAVKISMTFPNLVVIDELLSKINELQQNPKIKVLTGTTLKELKGYAGNFKAILATNPESHSESNSGPNPNPQSPINQLTNHQIEVGAIIVATGFELLSSNRYPEHKDIIDSGQFEGMLKTGKIIRPSDGTVPQKIVFIQCVGFREENTRTPQLTYCSKICCMTTAKQAYLYKKKVHSGQVYVFYTDIRAAGKGCEEFVQKIQEEERVLYLRGRVKNISFKENKIIVSGNDTLSKQEMEIYADMVILVGGFLSHHSYKELAKTLRLATNEYGFFSEAHPKLRPVETLTPGIFLAGCCQGPKDIPETISQALAASSKVLSLFSGENILHEPQIAIVDEKLCRGCRICIPLCPYEAREFDYSIRKIKVVEVKCDGCGICSASCPSGAAQQKNLTDRQVEKMMEAILV